MRETRATNASMVRRNSAERIAEGGLGVDAGTTSLVHYATMAQRLTPIGWLPELRKSLSAPLLAGLFCSFRLLGLTFSVLHASTKIGFGTVRARLWHARVPFEHFLQTSNPVQLFGDALQNFADAARHFWLVLVGSNQPTKFRLHAAELHRCALRERNGLRSCHESSLLQGPV